jgi:hypothetical protein
MQPPEFRNTYIDLKFTESDGKATAKLAYALNKELE